MTPQQLSAAVNHVRSLTEQLDRDEIAYNDAWNGLMAQCKGATHEERRAICAPWADFMAKQPQVI
jgi:hypothetical protein